MTTEGWKRRITEQKGETHFYSCKALYELCKAIDGCEYDDSLTELHGYIRRDIAREEYQIYKEFREHKRQPTYDRYDPEFVCFPYPRNARERAYSNPEIPWELIIPRKWMLHEQIRLTIEETINYWTNFFAEDIPGIHVYIDNIKDQTYTLLAAQIAPLIDPITLDFPQYGYAHETDGKPVKLNDLRFLEPEKHEELYGLVDDKHGSNRSEWVSQVIYGDIFEKFIPETYWTLKNAHEILEEHQYHANYTQVEKPKLGSGIPLII